MKLKNGIYKASNVTFNPLTCEAYSYGWWKFVAKIDGKVIFNNYRYSNTTTKHQYKVRRLLLERGITIDIEAPFPRGIECVFLESAILEAEENLCDQYLEAEAKRDERNQKAREARLAKKLAIIPRYQPSTIQFEPSVENRG